MTGQPTFAPLLEGFFTQRLMRQRALTISVQVKTSIPKG